MKGGGALAPRMTPAELGAIAAAVEEVREALSPEDRFDLRQHLAELLLTRAAPPKNLRAWARTVARNWTKNLLRDAGARRELLAAQNPGKYRTGDAWTPTWHPPHPDAVEGPWLACPGARVMHVAPGRPAIRDVQSAFVEVLDSPRAFRRRRKKAP